MNKQIDELMALADQYARCNVISTAIGASDAKNTLRSALETALKPTYDQQALELCNVCGWKSVIPDDGCLNCQRESALKLGKPVAAIHIGWDYLDNGKMVATYAVPVNEQVAPRLYTAAPPAQKPRHLTNEQIDALFDPRNGAVHGIHEVARRFARAIEAKVRNSLE